MRITEPAPRDASSPPPRGRNLISRDPELRPDGENGPHAVVWLGPANRVRAAANAIAQGNLSGGTAILTRVLELIDGASPPADWVVDSPQKTAVASDLAMLINLSLL